MSETENQLTQAAHDRLAAELEDLQTDGRKLIAERLLRARELGDLSENAEYHETKNQQGMMESRIRKLEHILRTSSIVAAPQAIDSAIAGSIVSLRSLDDRETETYLLAASKEETHKTHRTLTIGSPLGVAIAGKKVGDKVEYNAPGGTFHYEIVALATWDA